MRLPVGDRLPTPRRARSSSASRSAGAAAGDLEEDRQRDGRELGPVAVVDVAQLRQLLVVEDRRRAARSGGTTRASGSSRLPSGPIVELERRDELLADGVERRVGDLREELLEVVVEQPRPVREHRERRVGAHRADRLVAVARHRREEHAQVLVRVAEGLLALQHASRGSGCGSVRRPRQVVEVRRGCSSSHSPYGCAAASSRLISSSATMRPCSVSTRNMRPGCSRPLRTICSGGDVEHADLATP